MAKLLMPGWLTYLIRSHCSFHADVTAGERICKCNCYGTRSDEPLAPEGSVQVYVIALALNPPATPVPPAGATTENTLPLELHKPEV